MMKILTTIGAFIESPPRGAVIAFCWMFAWAITWSLVQFLKRLLTGAGIKVSHPCLEMGAIWCAWCVPMLIMVGLYGIDVRPAAIHSILIAMSYQATVRVAFTLIKKSRPEIYQALRTNRRADDTGEFVGTPR